MKQVSYVMRKKDNKYVITRYIFEGNKLTERFWVNTYTNKKDADWVFQNIYELSSTYKWRIIKDEICENIRELTYNYGTENN